MSRCYTTEQVRALLQMQPSTFTELKAKGRLPYVQELLPRSGKRARYRADLIDRYLAGEWNQPRLLVSHRRSGR